MSNPHPNQENLRKFTDMTPEEHREFSKKGNKASTESKRARKSMREMLDYLLQKPIDTEDGKIQTQEAILISTIQKAMGGSINAMSFIRDTIGEKPADKVIFNPTQENLNEVENLLKDDN